MINRSVCDLSLFSKCYDDFRIKKIQFVFPFKCSVHDVQRKSITTTLKKKPNDHFCHG